MEKVFPNIDEGINCKIFLGLRRLPPNPLAIYLFIAQNETHLQVVKASLGLDSFDMHYYLPNHWSMQILFLSLWQGSDPQTVFDFEQHKYQNLTPKTCKRPYVAKMFFSNPGRWTFLAITVSDTKMSKPKLCFSILLL